MGGAGGRFQVVLLLQCGLILYTANSLGQSELADDEVLAVEMQSGITPDDLTALRGLRQHVVASEHADQFVKNRTFGVNGTGQETVFVHEQLDERLPELRAKLWLLALRLDQKVGWGVFDKAGAKVTMRCVELLRYSGSTMGTEGVGWHADGATLMTMVIMLSGAGDFSGGSVEFRRSTAAHAVADERHNLLPGHALGWNGWTSHRVAPVTVGVREVFVVEWWVGEECAETLQPRAPDTVADIKYALQLAPNSGFLHRTLGETLCEQLPCDDEDGEGGTVAAAAEAAYRKAALLTPDDATTIHNLGFFLLGADMHRERAEGVSHIRRSHLLDPTVVGPIPPELLALGDPPILCRERLWPALCESMPVVMVEQLVRMVSAALALAVVGPAALWLENSNRRTPSDRV